MKSMRKLLLLAGMALAAVAFAVPASASASHWTQVGEGGSAPLAEEANVELSGSITWEQELIGSTYTCPTEAAATLNPGDTGAITSLQFDNEACEGTGLLAGCEMLESPVSTPFPMQLSSSNVRVSEVEWTSVMDEFCILPDTTFSGELQLTPDNSEAISAFFISGEGEMAGLGPITFSGELQVTPAATYGIG